MDGEPHTDLGHVRRWTVPAEPGSVARIRREVKAFGASRGVPERSAGDIAIAVSEALSNAVVHAYVDREPGLVEVVVEAADGEVVVRVTDSGRGMQVHHDSPGLGVGLPMIGRLARDVAISAGRGGRGTEVRMTFDAPGAHGVVREVRDEPDRLQLLSHVAEVTEGAGWPFASYELLLSILVPAVADACTLDVLDEARGHHRLGARVAGPRGGELSKWLAERDPPRDQIEATVETLRAGRPRVLELDPEMVGKLARGEEDARMMAGMELKRWVSLPLQAGDRLLGSLGLGFAPGRPDPDGQMPFLLAIADRASRGLANAQLMDELRRGGQRFERILDAVGAAVTVNDPTGRVVYANDAAVELLGAASADEVLAAAPGELAARFLVTHEDGSPVRLSELPGRRLLAGEEAPALLARAVARVTGREYWMRTTSRMLDPDNRLVVNIMEDVTETKTAELRQRFLAEAGDLLHSPRGFEETLDLLADLAVPQLADWCAIDLLTDEGLERVGLSHGDPAKLAVAREIQERWPAKTDAATPVGEVVGQGGPVLFAHITDEMLAERARDPEHLELLRRVGLRSAMIVPMALGERVLGVMTFANAESRRRFDEGDLRFAEELGHRAAAAIESARLASGGLTKRDLDLLAAAFEGSPFGLGIWDRDLRYLRVNRALAEINGLPVEDHIGRTIAEVVPDLDPEVIARYRNVIETGEPWMDVEVGGITPAAPGERRYWRTSTFPIGERGGRVEAIASVVSEITTERLIEQARNELEDRLAEKRAVLEEVIERVPMAIAVLWGPELRMRFVNRRWLEFMATEGEVVGRPVAEVVPDHLDLVETQFRSVLRTGEPTVIDEYPIGTSGPAGPVQRFYRSSNTPIRRGDAVVGVLSVFVEVTEEAHRRRRLETELAAEQELAETLQRALLPEGLPAVVGYRLAARYRPGGYEARVGGDFYDVFRFGDSLFLTIGDITGKGPQAASRAAFVRAAIRTLALGGEGPARVLDRASAALAAHSGGRLELCTAVCVRVGAEGSVEIAAAGHPPPFRFGAGDPEVVPVRGPILGVVDSGPRAEERLSLAPGEGLLLYTDGLTDATAPARIAGERDLADWISEFWTGEPEALLSGMVARAVPRGVAARDDVALLALVRSAAG